MQIRNVNIHPYRFKVSTGWIRKGALLELHDYRGNISWGDIAPLPQRNVETLPEALHQFAATKEALLRKEWHVVNCAETLYEHTLCPALYFAWESAIFGLLQPIQNESIATSALFMGSPDAILAQAKQREAEGFQVAKLKVSNLSFAEAAFVIHQLKNRFRLRIDVNQAWSTQDSLHFFSQFAPEELEYVEDPFQNPHDLGQFTHPLAVEESFLRVLSLQQLEQLPTLKALVFKPTSHGGYAGYLSLLPWTRARAVDLVLSSNFESDIGLANIAALACRLPPSNRHVIGIGTYHHMEEYLCSPSLQFSNGNLLIQNLNFKRSVSQIA